MLLKVCVSMDNLHEVESGYEGRAFNSLFLDCHDKMTLRYVPLRNNTTNIEEMTHMQEKDADCKLSSGFAFFIHHKNFKNIFNELYPFYTLHNYHNNRKRVALKSTGCFRFHILQGKRFENPTKKTHIVVEETIKASTSLLASSKLFSQNDRLVTKTELYKSWIKPNTQNVKVSENCRLPQPSIKKKRIWN